MRFAKKLAAVRACGMSAILVIGSGLLAPVANAGPQARKEPFDTLGSDQSNQLILHRVSSLGFNLSKQLILVKTQGESDDQMGLYKWSWQRNWVRRRIETQERTRKISQIIADGLDTECGRFIVQGSVGMEVIILGQPGCSRNGPFVLGKLADYDENGVRKMALIENGRLKVMIMGSTAATPKVMPKVVPQVRSVPAPIRPLSAPRYEPVRPLISKDRDTVIAARVRVTTLPAAETREQAVLLPALPNDYVVIDSVPMRP